MTETLDQLARATIKRWIASSGMTQTEVGRQVGRNQVWMSRYLKGKLKADVDTLQRLTRVFGHELTSLFTLPADPDDAAFLTAYRVLPSDARPLFRELLDYLWRGDCRP